MVNFCHIHEGRKPIILPAYPAPVVSAPSWRDIQHTPPPYLNKKNRRRARGYSGLTRIGSPCSEKWRALSFPTSATLSLLHSVATAFPTEKSTTWSETRVDLSPLRRFCACACGVSGSRRVGLPIYSQFFLYSPILFSHYKKALVW